MTAFELAAAVGLSRPPPSASSPTLEENGMLDRIEGRYTFGGEIARLGDLADPKAGVRQRITPLVQAAAESLGGTPTYGVRRSTSLLDLVVQATPRRVGLGVTNIIGQRRPLHASATGKLVFAELDPR